MKTLSKKTENIIIWTTMALCSLLFISLCFNENVWLDEAFTATLVHTSFKGVIERSMADTLPPLYNILLWATTKIFGYYIPVMKLTSVLPMILTLLLGAVKLRKSFGYITSVLFMICVTGMPLMFFYGIEIRMYSLGFFFATASGIYAYEIVKDFNRRNCIIFGLLSALAGYSHHFAFVAVGFIYLFLLLYFFFFNKKEIRRWFITLAITVVLYIPCGLITLTQLKSVSGYFTMPDVTPSLFIQYCLYPFSTGQSVISFLLIVLVAFLLLTAVLSVLRKDENIEISIFALCCFLVYYGVLLFGTVISKIMTANIFVDRYLFFSTGLISLFISLIIPRVKIKFTNVICCLILLLTIATTYYFQYKAEYGNSSKEEISYIKDNFSKGDLLYTVELQEELQYTIPFYAIYCGIDNLTYLWDISAALDDVKGNPEKTLWIVVQDGYDLSSEEVQAISESGLTMEYAQRFDFDRYGCDLYKVN